MADPQTFTTTFLLAFLSQLPFIALLLIMGHHWGAL